MLSQKQYDSVVQQCNSSHVVDAGLARVLLAWFRELYRAHDAVCERFQTDTQGLLYDEDGNPRLEL